MDGERATAIYIAAVLGADPDLQNEEEKEYYSKINSDIEKAKEKYGSNVMFEIPDD